MDFGILGKNRQKKLQNDSERASISDQKFWDEMAGRNVISFSGEPVGDASAMDITAFSSALNAVSDAFAQLPIHVYKTTSKGRERDESSALYPILHDTINEDLTSAFDWKKGLIYSLFLKGRACSLLRKDGTGTVNSIEPLVVDNISNRRVDDRLVYDYIKPNGEIETYQAHEVIDLVKSPDPNRKLGRWESPVVLNRNTIGKAIALEKYSARIVSGGGIIPQQLVCTLEPGAVSPEKVKEAYKAAVDAMKRAAETDAKFIGFPPGFELRPIGVVPSELQMVEMERTVLLDVARVFNLPPMFLQDLSTGTYSNTEQQGAVLVKHTLMPIIVQFTQQLNAKAAGRRQDIEINVDAFMRADYAARMEGHAKSVQNAIRTPNEARGLEGLAPMLGGDVLLIQGATVPLAMAGNHLTQPTPETPSE